ncbi:M18 family aminopeptidase [Intestinimonas massiliensis (ex Afouda et al. 2020)]|uniref:M18 family aminopeptidase n=1 Tax=Intestinimonas massiliensis (ex Afouda et al. 2020) TaxID=1673721 RepID=UPI001030DFE5|nr:M18 family aminopeptidase [Intestinimonas massiliensis (ex Afouda et al. 2020)]
MSVQALMDFIERSPSPYHAAAYAAKLLEGAGFLPLEEHEKWELTPGQGYYVTRNQSSLIAFRLPWQKPERWLLTAAHSDSPTFAVKNDRLEGDKTYLRLAVEGYGGMNCASWLDRPLTVAGRVLVRTGGGAESRLVYLDRDLLTIPSLAIHMQRDVNKGHEYNPQRDMQPLYGLTGSRSLTELLAEELGVEKEALLAWDLVLCPRQKPVVLGAEGELFQAPRIDDLGCAWACLEGLISAGGQEKTGQIYCLFDNEEVGSGTRQGALSTFLPDVLERIACCLSMDGQEQRMALAGSMLLSADNGHAVHPNFTEKSDPANRVYPNGGVVVKYSANQKYTTNSLTAGVFRAVCQKAGVPVQTFANRADEPGGSTLGNLLGQQVSIPMVDIGMAQLAMHSAVETAGSKDPDYLAGACAAFYQSALTRKGDGRYSF